MSSRNLGLWFGVLCMFVALTRCGKPSPQVVATEYSVDELTCVHMAKTPEEADDCACKVRKAFDSGTAWKVCDAGKDGAP